MSNLPPQRPIKVFSGDSKFIPCPKPEKVVKEKYDLQKAMQKKKAGKESGSVIGALVYTLDTLFSVFIRSENADQNGNVKCVTCPKIQHWRKMDCGHFFSRKSYAIRWEPINCGAQCKECNIEKRGEFEKFKAYINAKYGPETSDTLYALTKVDFHLDRNELESKIQHYKQLITPKK